MSVDFREIPPSRNCSEKYDDYRRYKTHLREDFNKRCGYTDCPDFWFGGKNTFHIDHFIPWKKYPARPNLKTDYSNLVYSCSYVNILKSDHEGDFIDPVNVDFNKHFERDIDGGIVPKTGSVAANFMYKKLRLYIRRYKIIWKLEKLVKEMKKVKGAIEMVSDEDLKKDLRAIQGDLANLLIEYLNYLETEQ